MKDLLRIADLTTADLRLLLSLSSAVAEDPHRRADLLEGDAVVCYFAKPSTRTRLSFGSAIAHLGGVPEIVNGTCQLDFRTTGTILSAFISLVVH